MSRGLGKIERELLDEISTGNGLTVVAEAGRTPSENEARRRAARSLTRKGLACLRTSYRGTGKRILLTFRAAAEWDARAGHIALEKAQDKQEEARQEEWDAFRAIKTATSTNKDPQSNINDGTQRAELRIVISLTRGRESTIDFFLNDLEDRLGGTWKFVNPRETKDGVSVTAVLDSDIESFGPDANH